ncbi:MAG: alcohol dehydrogenase catalytic domain-containing protein, partial [Candidatus Poribacteria bacterium]|nr:alcohol dehydrogenase catalytic domain-containing protein [Candidatus Poribacteria bacterium]
MKTAVFEETGKLSVQDKPVPHLDAGDVLIKVDLCGICASDLAALNGDVTDYSPPVVMGHELAGVVVESRHPDVKIGEKVTVNPMLSCGHCEYCRADLDKYCETIEGIGHDIDGGYAEYLRMPKHGVDTGKLIAVPDAIPPEELIFLEPLGCCINAMRET